MRVLSSSVAMTSYREYQESYAKTERLEAWVGERPARPARPAGDRLEISPEAQSRRRAEKTEETDEERLARLTPGARIMLLILRELLRVELTPVRMPAAADTPEIPQGGQPAPAGWGLDYELHESYQESESVDFQAKGVVRTADGREISFEAYLHLSRSFAMERHVRIQAGDALRPVDPLVINYAGPAADLLDKRFAFDLDADGRPEEIPYLKPGSGFLALDRNGDGRVNDGSELFGPRTGDGFAELAAFDQNGDGWIDEWDEIFAQLRVWSGGESLQTLGALGIGAIFLGSVATPFTMTNQQNQAQAKVQKTGVFLREDGTAGTVQHIDMLV